MPFQFWNAFSLEVHFVLSLVTFHWLNTFSLAGIRLMHPYTFVFPLHSLFNFQLSVDICLEVIALVCCMFFVFIVILFDGCSIVFVECLTPVSCLQGLFRGRMAGLKWPDKIKINICKFQGHQMNTFCGQN